MTDSTKHEPGRQPVSAQLTTLETMDYGTLQSAWRRLYRAQPPPRVARGLLMLGVGWKIQERAYGGLSASMKRRVNDLAKIIEEDGDMGRDRVVQLRPGATLIREWHGKTHEVRVLEDGFKWRGELWRSLSQIAREITGTRWSGPRFFGLQRRNAKSVEAADG